MIPHLIPESIDVAIEHLERDLMFLRSNDTFAVKINTVLQKLYAAKVLLGTIRELSEKDKVIGQAINQIESTLI